jgi:hypothetical protein
MSIKSLKTKSMKKILIMMSCVALGTVACKKKYDDVSKVVNVSYPTISFTGSKFYSVNVGAASPTIQATAYDSVLNESYTVDYDPSVIDVNTPGLYVVPMNARNKNGYVGSDVVYVAVTNIAPAIDLSGTYKRTSNNEPVHITEVANGLYETDDVGGAATLEVTAYFAQLNDSTLTLPEQPTEVGTLYAVNAKVTGSGAPGTAITWAVRNGFFGTAQRTFVKQ